MIRFRFWFRRVAFPFGLIAVLAMPSLVPAATPTGDPSTDPVPTLDYDTPAKAIVVNLYFTGPLSAIAESVEVVAGPAPGTGGAAPMLNNGLYDLNGNLLEQFYAWHPLLDRTYDASGLDHASMLSEGSGVIVFPYRPDAATLNVWDVTAQQQLVALDLVPAIHTFCRNDRSDPNCTNIANRLPTCNADGPYKVECGGKTTNVKLDGTKCTDPDKDLLSYTWSGSFQGGTAVGATPTVQFSGLGFFGVNLSVEDDFGGRAACSSAVTVLDTTPPTITSVNASQNSLWPPDHKMVPVAMTALLSDRCDPHPGCRIAAVTSNEPVDGLGDGDTAPDWEITGDMTVDLRAERSGTGGGRIYTVTVTCTDASGNSASRATNVTVPKAQ